MTKINKLESKDVQWVVNSSAELGVKIGNQFFWLYRDGSISYTEESEVKDMKWRPIMDKEFGRSCRPVDFEDLGPDVAYEEGKGWRPLPVGETKEELDALLYDDLMKIITKEIATQSAKTNVPMHVFATLIMKMFAAHTEVAEYTEYVKTNS